MRQHTGLNDRLATFLRGEAGGVVTLTALCLVVLIGMVGLAVDTGHLLAARNELQNAADAAAIAGVRASDFKEALDYKLNQSVLLPVVPGGDDWGTKDTRKISNFVGFMITGGSQGGKYLTGYFVQDCATPGAGGGGPDYGVLGGSPRLVN